MYDTSFNTLEFLLSGLFERRRCMRQALYTHCKQTVSPSQCNPPDSSVNVRSRRKRQTEEAPVDGIK